MKLRKQLYLDFCGFIWCFGCEISHPKHHINIKMPENCVLLGCYAASSCNFFPTFQDNLSVSSLTVKNTERMPRNVVRRLYSEELGR